MNGTLRNLPIAILWYLLIQVDIASQKSVLEKYRGSPVTSCSSGTPHFLCTRGWGFKRRRDGTANDYFQRNNCISYFQQQSWRNLQKLLIRHHYSCCHYNIIAGISRQNSISKTIWHWENKWSSYQIFSYNWWK